jgi:hypothetical protein
MGNHLSTIAHGIGLQLWAFEHYNLSTQMILRHQTIPATPPVADDSSSKLWKGLEQTQLAVIDSPKWIPTSQTLKRCFPAMADWDFSLGSQWKEFDRSWVEQFLHYNKQLKNDRIDRDSYPMASQQQEQRLFAESSKINGRIMAGRQNVDNMKEPITVNDIDDGLSAFVQLWDLEQRQKHHDTRSTSSSLSTSTSLLTKPFLYSDSMDSMVLINRYLPFFRHLFRIDPSCCGSERPDPDESVFVSR